MIDTDALYQLKDGVNCDLCGKYKPTIQVADIALNLSVDACKDCITSMFRNYVQLPVKDAPLTHKQWCYPINE